MHEFAPHNVLTMEPANFGPNASNSVGTPRIGATPCDSGGAEVEKLPFGTMTMMTSMTTVDCRR